MGRILLLLCLALALGPGPVLASPAQAPKAGPQGSRIDAAALRGILDAFLEQKRPFLPQARIGFKSLTAPEPFVLPPGRMTTEVIPADPDLLHSRRFTVIFRVNGEVARNLVLRAELEAIAPVAVAAGDLQRGMLLTERDLNLAEVDLVEVRQPCFDLRELVGKKLKRSVRLGEPLERSSVEFPPLVQRGEVVTLIARRGAVTVTARGEARQDGGQGETIRVRNLDSRRDLSGRVAGAGLIEMEF